MISNNENYTSALPALYSRALRVLDVIIKSLLFLVKDFWSRLVVYFDRF